MNRFIFCDPRSTLRLAGGDQNSTSSSSSSSGSAFASATHCSIAGQTMMDRQ